MRKIFVSLIAALVLAGSIALPLDSANARGRGGHGGGWGWGVGVGLGMGLGAEALWGWPGYAYGYPYAVYPYDYVPPSPVVVVQQAPAAVPSQYWYYCGNPKGYYPYVASCMIPWQAVVPTPPPAP